MPYGLAEDLSDCESELRKAEAVVEAARGVWDHYFSHGAGLLVGSNRSDALRKALKDYDAPAESREGEEGA